MGLTAIFDTINEFQYTISANFFSLSIVLSVKKFQY